VEDIYKHWDTLVDSKDLPALNEIITDLVADPPRTERGLEQVLIPSASAKHLLGPLDAAQVCTC
jgi:hypothetical protein